jgi:hypothetical protein
MAGSARSRPRGSIPCPEGCSKGRRWSSGLKQDIWLCCFISAKCQALHGNACAKLEPDTVGELGSRLSNAKDPPEATPAVGDHPGALPVRLRLRPTYSSVALLNYSLNSRMGTLAFRRINYFRLLNSAAAPGLWGWKRIANEPKSGVFSLDFRLRTAQNRSRKPGPRTGSTIA